jgi:hypothetical protein
MAGLETLVPASLSVFGIYLCQNLEKTHTPGTSCFKLVTLSAMNEWILSVLWMGFLITLAVDLYYIIDVREEFIVRQNNVQDGEVVVHESSVLEWTVDGENIEGTPRESWGLSHRP